MNVLSVLEWVRLWIRAAFRAPQVERDLDREMRFHLEMEIEQNIRDGLPPDEARRTALLAFGGVERHKESVRDQRGVRWIEELLSDARLAARSFKKHPGFTATAVLTIAIGIGAATAVFSLANWILLRPLPGVAAPGELVSVGFYAQGPDEPAGVSYPTLIDLARGTPSLVSLAATQPTAVQFAAPGGTARELEGETIAGDYFGTLGVRPRAGRLFQTDELDAASVAQVAVISDRLWRSTFASSPSVLGTSVRMNGADFTIVGVASPRFLGISRVGNTDVWLPPSSYRISRHGAEYDVVRRKVSAFNTAIGRLAPGASVEIVERQMRAETSLLGLAYPDLADRYAAFPPHVTLGAGTPEYARAYIEHTLRVLAAVVAVVLLISCANAANLLLFRGVRRRGEMAVRRALGASTNRLVRLHVTEGVLLGLVGGVFGLLVSVALRLVLRNQSLPGFPPVAELSTDRRVLLFAITLSLATGALFAVMPAILALRVDFLSKLKEAARSDVGGAARIRRALIVLQIAASMTLVVAGVLFARTISALHGVGVGMDVEHTSAFSTDPAGQGYDPAHIARFRAEVVRQISARPGIDNVTIASNAPFSGSAEIIDLRPTGFDGKGWPVQSRRFSVSPNYFATMSIPLLAGETVSVPDPRADPADTTERSSDVVIGQSTARYLFGMDNPLGRSVDERTYKGVVTHRVVGVAGDVRTRQLRGDPDLVMYEPRGREWFGDFGVIIVRSSLRAAEVDRIVRDAVSKVDAAVPVSRSYVVSAGIARVISAERLLASLVTTLATLTVILMAVGLYSVVAYSVAERTQEIGVRMALGATTAAVVRLVARQSLGLVALGVVLGVAASVAVSRFVESWLFGVTRLNVTSYVIAAAILVSLGAVAAIAPARAAAAINPVDALRHE